MLYEPQLNEVETRIRKAIDLVQSSTGDLQYDAVEALNRVFIESGKAGVEPLLCFIEKNPYYTRLFPDAVNEMIGNDLLDLAQLNRYRQMVQR